VDAKRWIGLLLCCAACGTPEAEVASDSDVGESSASGSDPTSPGLASSTGGSTGMASSTDAQTNGVTGDLTGGSGSSDTSSSDTSGGTELPPYPDLALGPYPSLTTQAIDSMLSNTNALDTSTSYGHSAAQGYVLQAIGELLWHARDYELAEREALIDAALVEIDELEASADMVVGGGPAFGLEDAWDAFGDGSTNPAFTAYTWQSGMVALGVAKIVRVLDDAGHPDTDEVRAFGEALIERWDDHYTSVADGGYWWYSTQPSDAIAVHNTSALVAMASQILSESGSPASFAERPPQTADLLWARTSGNPTDGYTWNYADDGYPLAQRRAEDVSHALVTTQLMREAGERGWWSASQMQGVAATLTDIMWSGHPARLHGFVDGTDGGESEWAWSRAAVIAYAAHGDAPGGDPAVFELGRSLYFSSYLSRFERAFEGGTVDGARTLAIALMLSHRPDGLRAGTAWETVAGPGDDAAPAAPGGVRFYTVDWGEPADLSRGLTLPARTSTTANANVVVDIEDGEDRRLLVSLTYASATEGVLQQWDGASYRGLGPMPATLDDEGTVRWMRTTFELGADRFDYQDGVPGTNVLLQVTHPAISMSRIEASPIE